jgi:hypothetical protein
VSLAATPPRAGLALALAGPEPDASRGRSALGWYNLPFVPE